jgi:DNA-binding CsgD family transcriptional regulator
MLGDDAWLFALDGDGAAACAKAREAQHAAPTAAWQVRGLAGRAAIASAFREDSVASTFVEEAWTLSRSIDWQTVSSAERLGLLLLADASAMFDGDRAARVLAVYDASTPQTGAPARRWPADLRVRGWEAYVRASTARARRDSAAAAALYAAALDDFRACSYRWREAETLFALAALPPGERCDQIRAPLDEAVALVQRHLPDSFLARRVAGWRRIFIDPCGVRLSPAQRDVLRLVLEGRSLRAIASSKGRDYETIKSHARAVHRSFGTRDNHHLVAECARRGIFPPSFEQSS